MIREGSAGNMRAREDLEVFGYRGKIDKTLLMRRLMGNSRATAV
jgi:hypothetical protein